MSDISIKKNLAYSTFYQILTMIIPLITAPYVSRVIGVEGIGTYSYITSIQTYFSLFAALGTATYGTREIARNRNDKHKTSILFWEIELLTVFTSLICLFAWCMFIGFSNTYKVFYTILTLNLFNTMFDITWLYNGLEKFKYTVIRNSFFKILGIILLFVCIKSSNDLLLYIIINCVTGLLGTLSMWLYLPKFVNKVSIKELNVFKHFKTTLVYFVPTIATSIYTVLDKTLLGVLVNDNKENGYYEQATKIINMTKSITFSSLNSVLTARMSYLFAEKKQEEIHSRINTSINYILFMGLGIMFGIISIADDFVPIFFGQGYDKVILLLKLLSPLPLIIGISNCLGSHYYTPAGLKSKSSKFIIIGAVVNFTLNIVFIPKLLSTGAIIATLVAELIITLLYLRFCNGYLKINNLLKFSWKKLAGALIMWLSIEFIPQIFVNSLVMVVFKILFGICIYVSILILLKDDFTVDILKNKIINRFWKRGEKKWKIKNIK